EDGDFLGPGEGFGGEVADDHVGQGDAGQGAQGQHGQPVLESQGNAQGWIGGRRVGKRVGGIGGVVVGHGTGKAGVGPDGNTESYSETAYLPVGMSTDTGSGCVRQRQHRAAACGRTAAAAVV